VPCSGVTAGMARHSYSVDHMSLEVTSTLLKYRESRQVNYGCPESEMKIQWGTCVVGAGAEAAGEQAAYG
jgi:hypothetical protein